MHFKRLWILVYYAARSFDRLPMFMEIGLERGFRGAPVDFIIMKLQLC